MEDAKAVEKEISRKRRSLEESLSENERALAKELLKKHGEIKVCANCASLELKMPPASMDISAAAFKETWRYYCAICGYEGIGLIFTGIEPYEKFFQDRRSKYNGGHDQIEPNYLLPGSFSDSGREKKPYVAVLLAFFIPGLGQAYNGELKKAVRIFALYASSTALARLASTTDLLIFGVPAILGLLVAYIYAITDAYAGARKTQVERRRRRPMHSVSDAS